MCPAVIDFIKTGSVVMDFSVKEVVEAVDGELVAGSMESRIAGVSIDSRAVASGDAFFALKGANFDAHAFISEAAGKGAAAVVVERTGFDTPDGLAVIKVNESLRALGDMAARIRVLSKVPLVAVSGTTGKTTTRDMIASILRRSRRVLKTEGNKNNLVGLPLTLFRLDSTHQSAVVELGISEPWEMSRLVEIARPDVAIITNIGSGHLETLGDLKGVAEAKSALFTDPAPECVRIVNLDDPFVREILEGSMTGKSIDPVTFSLCGPADVTVASYAVLEELEGIDVEYDVRGERVCVRLNSPAVCNVINGAAAIAASLPLGVSLGDIKEGLEGFEPVAGRLTVFRCGGVTVIDDTYNANPDSMEAALQTLSAALGRKVAVVGDMLELGDTAACAHTRVGTRAAELGIDVLVAVGGMAGEVANGALLSGIRADSIYCFSEKEAAIEAVGPLLRPGDSILVKASRGMGLESIVEVIKKGSADRRTAL